MMDIEELLDKCYRSLPQNSDECMPLSGGGAAFGPEGLALFVTIVLEAEREDCKQNADALESQAAEIAKLTKQRDELLVALEKTNHAYVILMENGRDRIRDLGGECDAIDVMERNDPCLKESRAAITSVKEQA